MSHQQGGIFPGFLKTAFFLGFAGCVGLLFRQYQILKQHGYKLKLGITSIDNQDLKSLYENEDDNNPDYKKLKEVLKEFERSKKPGDVNRDTGMDNRFLILKNERDPEHPENVNTNDYYMYAQGVDGKYFLSKVDPHKNILEGLDLKRLDPNANDDSGLGKIKNIIKRIMGENNETDAQVIEKAIRQFNEEGHLVTGKRRSFDQTTVNFFGKKVSQVGGLFSGAAAACSASAMGLVKQMPTMLGYQAMNRAFMPSNKLNSQLQPSLRNMAANSRPPNDVDGVLRPDENNNNAAPVNS